MAIFFTGALVKEIPHALHPTATKTSIALPALPLPLQATVIPPLHFDAPATLMPASHATRHPDGLAPGICKLRVHKRDGFQRSRAPLPLDGGTTIQVTRRHRKINYSHKPDGVAAHGARAHAEHTLNAGGQAEAEAREQGGQGAAGEEREDDEREDLDGVALRVVDEVAQEALELLVSAGQEVGPGRAPVGGGRGPVLIFILPRGGGVSKD